MRKKTVLREALAAGLGIRLFLTVMSVQIDRKAIALGQPNYTDVDYSVLVDGARHVLLGGSPYDRETFRYPPIVAWFLLPACFYPLFGKVLFSVLDTVAAFLLAHLTRKPWAGVFWALNPVTILISTRGSFDSCIILLLLLLLKYPESGALMGFAIYFRIFPVIFAPWHLLRAKKKLRFFSTSVLTCVALLGVTFLLYGQHGLNESFLYHFARTDHRHNFTPFWFSAFAALNGTGHMYAAVVKWARLAAQAGVLAVLNLKKLPRGVFHFFASFYFVHLNSVVTAQYFLWYLIFLPFLHIPKKYSIWIFWILAQVSFLYPAWLLEFTTKGTFYLAAIGSLVSMTLFVTAGTLLLRAQTKSDKRE